MTEHKATPEQWTADRFDWSRADTEAMDGDPAFRCIMELRARVEALEVAAKPVESNTPASSDLLVGRVADAIYSSATGGIREEARAAILAVADWFEQQGSHTPAARLRQEVG